MILIYIERDNAFLDGFVLVVLFILALSHHNALYKQGFQLIKRYN